MHYYGDDWEHWDTLHQAISEILDYWRSRRLGSHGKEKFGTFRDHVFFSDGTLFSVLYPGYVYIPQWYQWFYFRVDYPVIRRVTYWTGIQWLYRKWQVRVYREGIQRAVRKYPEVAEELVSSIDYPELLQEIK